MSISNKVTDKLKRTLKSPLSVLFLAAASFLDTFLFFIPSDGLLVATLLASPQYWLIAAVSITAGSVFGSLCLAHVVQTYGLNFISEIYPSLETSSTWLSAIHFFEKYGDPAIFLTAISPFTQQPTVILAALANIPLKEIALWLIAGRFIKYLFIAYVTKFLPEFIKRIPFLSKEYSKVKN